jgi:REP element-mobilizing transposase RayT
MMIYDPQRHHRHSIRLQGYDYTQPGAYFITICAYQRECLFGEIQNGQMALNEYGRIAQACWEEIPRHFENVELDEWVVMPNHIHGIMVIVDVGTTHSEGATQQAGTTHSEGATQQAGTTHLEGAIQQAGTTHSEGATQQAGTTHLEGATQQAGTTHLEGAIQQAGTTHSEGATHWVAPAKGPPPGSIGAIVGQFKSVVARRINASRNMSGAPVWQRNYHERIIRNERALYAIRQYIQNNPLKWTLDRDNPANA